MSSDHDEHNQSDEILADTETLEDTDTLAAPAQVQSDVFAAVLSLIEFVTHPAACRKRVEALRGAEAAAKRAEQSLATARAEHDAYLATGLAELEKERRELLAQKVAFEERKGRFEDWERVVKERAEEIDARTRRYEQHGGITREFVPGFPREPDTADAHERQIPEGHFDGGDDLEAEHKPVEGAPGLSQTTYRENAAGRRRSSRRHADARRGASA